MLILCYSKKVKFTQQKKPDRKANQYSQYTQYKPTTEASENFDEEELAEISLEEALMKIEKIQSQIDEINEAKKKVITNQTMTEISKKLRCKPYNEKIKEHRKTMKKYEKVRAKHLGILDKLPKDSPLYSFAYNCQIAHKLKKIADNVIDLEKIAVDKFIERGD